MPWKKQPPRPGPPPPPAGNLPVIIAPAPGPHGGRATKWQPHFTEEVRKLASLGVSEEDAAWFLGVHPATFVRWKKRRPELCEAIKKGQSLRNVNLYQQLYIAASTDRNPGVLIFLAKNWLGMTDKQISELQGQILIKYLSHIPQENNNQKDEGQEKKGEPPKELKPELKKLMKLPPRDKQGRFSSPGKKKEKKGK